MSEDALIQGCLKKSSQHQKLLYERYAARMYAVCLRYARIQSDAVDILQDGFVKVFLNIQQYKSEGSFEGWIRRIMVHTALRHYQRQRFESEVTGHEHIPEKSLEPEVLATLSEGELMELIAKLPEGYRLVFNLVAIEGYSHAEVAEMLQIQESTSRSQLAKARKWLAEQLEHTYGYVRAAS